MTSLFILEGNRTIAKIPSLIKRLETLSHPTYDSLKAYYSALNPRYQSESDAVNTDNDREVTQNAFLSHYDSIHVKHPETFPSSLASKKYHFIFESPLTYRLRQMEKSIPLDQDRISHEIIENGVEAMLQWKSNLLNYYDTVTTVLLTTEDHIASRRISYEWEWTQGESDLLEKKRYVTEENMKLIWDSYFEAADEYYNQLYRKMVGGTFEFTDINVPNTKYNKNAIKNDSLWDIKTPSDDSRQCIWLLLAQLSVEYESESFEQHFDPNNTIRRKNMYRGGSFHEKDFL